MPRALTQTYSDLYRLMLREFGGRWPTACPAMTAFWPMVGHEYTGELMVIGRAVNGWSDEVVRALLRSDDGVSHVAARARQEAEGTGRCPMRWVSDSAGGGSEYNTNRSAFWRVARRVGAGLDVLDAGHDSWPSAIAWSNLYKLAPHSGRNPSNAACEAQWPPVARLLAKEVEELAPRRVLVMAGKSWAEDFAIELGLSVQWDVGCDDANTPVAGTADALGARWVVAAHPERKGDQPIIDAVISAFESQGG